MGERTNRMMSFMGGLAAAGMLRDPGARDDVAAPAFSLFEKLCGRWRLGPDDRRTLLGDVPSATYYRWRRSPPKTLTRDQLERISLLLGIHKGLRLVFADDDAANRWLHARNEDLEFGGASPLQVMLRGGISDLYAVRRYLDAWRGAK